MTQKTPKRPGKKIITPDEAARAIWVDYECSQDRAPTLLGYRFDGKNSAAIVEPLFKGCADRWGARQVMASDHAKLVAGLVVFAAMEGRVIVSWSEFDYAHMRAALTGLPLFQSLLGEMYRNAIYTARRWRRVFQPNYTEGGNELARYLDHFTVHVPERFGPGIVGDSLRLIRTQLRGGRSWSQLTPAARRSWRTVVRHNRYDSEGMEHVVQRMARTLADESAIAVTF